MGMMYSCPFEAVAVSAAQDFFELLAPSTGALILHSVRLGQSSDEGDAAAEMLDVSIVRGEGSVTSGSGGSAGTEVPLQSGLAAAEAAVELNNTTNMLVGSGALILLLNDSFNVQVGWLYQPTPEERITVSPSDRLTIELVGAPADALTMSGTITWEEIGGT